MASRHWSCTYFACLLVLAAGPSEARTLAEIKTSGVLKIGLTGDYPPYDIKGPDGKFTGYDVTMARTLAEDFGVTLKIVPTRWNS